MQSLKASLRSHQVHLDAFTVEKAELKAEQASATDRLRAALGTLAEVNQAAVEPLMSVAQGDECEWMKDCLPEAATGSEAIP